MNKYRDNLLDLAYAAKDAGVTLTVTQAVDMLDTLIARGAVATGNPFDPTTHEGRVATALGNPVVMDYMREGKKINAIKELRGLTGCGLKEAKDAVEDYRVINESGYRPNWT